MEISVGGHYPGWKLSGVGVVRGESCTAGNCPRCEFVQSEMSA